MTRESDQTSSVRRLGGWIVLTTAAGLALQIVLLICLWRGAYHPLPWHDEWDTIELLRQIATNPGDFKPWFALHNEHRLVLPRVVFAADFWLFSGRHVFTFAVSALLAFGLVAVFVRESRWLASSARTTNLIGVALAAMLLCGQQASNFIWAFQVQWFLVHFFTVAGAASVASAARAFVAGRAERAGVLIALALITTIGANYSTASGNLAWISTGLTALLLRDRLPKWTLVAIGFAGALSIGLYAFGFRLSGTGSGSLRVLQEVPLSGIAFLLAFFGVPFAPFGKGAATLAGGLFMIGTFVLFGQLFFVRLLARAATDAFCLGLLAFVACVGLVTTAGRLGLGVDAALESRLASVVSVGWGALVLAVFARLASVAAASGLLIEEGRLFRFSVFAVAVCLGVGIGGFLKPPYDYSPIVDLKRSAASAIVAGAVDVEALERVGFPNPNGVQSSLVRGFLLKVRRSIFADSAALIGSSIRALPFDGSCKGGIDQIDPLASGARVAGWAWAGAASSAGATVLLADSRDVVVGVGFLGVRREDIAAEVDKGAIQSGWRGHTSPGATPGALYLVAANQLSACPATGILQVPRKLGSGNEAVWPEVTHVMFNAAAVTPVKRLAGLSVLESFGRWSNAKLIVVEFDRPLPRSFEVDLVVGGYGANIGAAAEVLVGPQAKELTIEGGIDDMRSQRLDFAEVGETAVLAIVVPQPTVPRRVDPKSADERPLGIVLQSITIRPRVAPPR